MEINGYKICEDAKLMGANLMGANLSGANLRVADLRGADLKDANLMGANLMGANLSGANLMGANLSGANLRVADLRYAGLKDTNLMGANLMGANLSGANLMGAKGIVGPFNSTDNYNFYGVGHGDNIMIKAGCRWFNSTDAKHHWETTRKDTKLGRERLILVDTICELIKNNRDN